jgi:hypothetical protein
VIIPHPTLMVVHEVLHEADARYEGWRVAFASAVSWFLASSLIYTFAVFFKPLAAEFSWSRDPNTHARVSKGHTACERLDRGRSRFARFFRKRRLPRP